MNRCILLIFSLNAFLVKLSDQVELGVTAKEHQYPSHLLLNVFEQKTHSKFCGATIIYPTYLLTTRTCVKNKDQNPQITIISGVNMSNPVRQRDSSIIRNIIVAKTVDLALIHLKEPFGPIYDFPNIPMPHRNYIYIGIKSFPFKDALFCGHGQTESSEYSTVLKSIDMVVGDVASCNVPEKFNFICGVVGDKNKPILMAGPRHGDEGGALIFYDEKSGMTTMYAIFVGHKSNKYYPKFIYIPYIAEWIEMVTNHKIIED